MSFAFAIARASPRQASEDRAAVIEHGGGLVVVVADGAGGMRGGAMASDAIITAAKAHVAGDVDVTALRAWSRVFAELDRELTRTMRGETTGIVLLVGEHGVVGLAAGDGEAWIVSDRGIDRLTGGARTKRVGSGCCEPVPFHRPPCEGTLVVATDGLFKHADAEAIASTCAGDDLDAIASALAGLPCRASSRHPDDVAVVLVRGR